MQDPELRLRTIEAAGQAAVPYTSGLLIGFGETREERVQSLLDLRALHRQYGHIQVSFALLYQLCHTLGHILLLHVPSRFLCLQYIRFGQRRTFSPWSSWRFWSTR